MIRSRLTVALAGLLVVAVSPAPAPAAPPARVTSAARPNFTGTWRLNPGKSEFGKMPGGQPRARTDVIEHRGPSVRQTLYLVNETRRDTTVYRYLTDSTESVNRVADLDIQSRVWWEGSVLRLESKTKLLLFEMTLKDRWTLGPDGKTLTMSRRVKYPMGEGEQRLVFERQ